MDRENFDTWSRRFAATPSRRTALTALLGLAISGTLSHITAQPAHSKRRKRARRRQDAPGSRPKR